MTNSNKFCVTCGLSAIAELLVFGGHWNGGHLAIKLVEEIGKCTANITDSPKETACLFQQLSVALQRGNAVSFHTAFAASQSVIFSST